jgi:RNA polymerase sigma-70 factor (ECF subfamily)
MADEAWDALRIDLARGEARAFAELYDRLAAPMFGVARRIVHSEADAEDAVHQTFLELLRHRRAFAAARDPRAYALSALRRTARRSCERRTEVREQEERAAPGAIEPEPDARIARALDGLPLEQREVVALKLDGGLSFAEIGALLRISPNTAASRYRYALERLRARLEDPR